MTTSKPGADRSGETTYHSKQGSPATKDVFNTAMIDACFRWNLGELRQQVQRGADVNFMDPSAKGISALHISANKGYTEIVQLLLANGARTDLLYLDGLTPLHLAAMGRQIDTARLLIAAGAQVNAAADNNVTPLNSAIQAAIVDHKGTEVDVARLLIENGADVRIKTLDGSSMLHWAARSGDPEMIRLLLANGADADISARSNDGWTPIYGAIRYGKTEPAAILRERTSTGKKRSVPPLKLTVKTERLTDDTVTSEEVKFANIKQKLTEQLRQAGFRILPPEAKNNEIELRVVYRERFSRIDSQQKMGIIKDTFGDKIEFDFKLVNPSNGVTFKDTLVEEPRVIQPSFLGIRMAKGADAAGFEKKLDKFGELVAAALE